MSFEQILKGITFVAYLANMFGDCPAQVGVMGGGQVVEQVVFLNISL